MIFYLLRSIRLDHLFDYSKEMILDTLQIFIKWLQVSVNEYNCQARQTKSYLCLGTWFRETEGLVRPLPG